MQRLVGKARISETEVGQMAEKQSTSKTQREQRELFEQGMSDPRTAEFMRVFDAARVFVPLPQAEVSAVTYSTDINRN